VAFHRAGGHVALRSRQRRLLTPYFPEITTATTAQIPAGTVLDGELVLYRDARCDFASLQHRTCAPARLAAAASLVVFDLLALGARACAAWPIASAENGCSDTPTTPGHRCC
jgi:ATP-dependent DNA ligase